MSTEEIAYAAMIFLVGIPAAVRLTGLWIYVRNPVALAMVASWAVCRVLYETTGEAMPVQAMILSDMVVIAAMFVKEDWQQCGYETLRRQMGALWWERTPWDRAILALFPMVWIFYFPVVDPTPQYWTLYLLGLGQLILAGLEALHQWRGQSANKSRAADERPPGLGFTAWGIGYG